MRISHRMTRPRIPVAAACLLLIAAQPGFANWLYKGTDAVPQWGLDAAKTPTPSYDKDATAVVLYDEYVETVDAKGRAVEREREAIRILKPQGRRNGCAVSYDVDEKIRYFREWTLTADGKQFEAQDTDFLDAGDSSIPVELSTRKRRVVNAPAVDVGAVEICESEEQLAPYLQEKFWSIQNGIPVVLQALEVDLPAGRPHAESWHRYQPVTPVEVTPNHWRWELKDVHALVLRDVLHAPDWEALAARMSVQWGAAAVEGKDNQWRAIGKWTSDLEAHRPDPTPEISARAQQLTAGASDFYSKLTPIADYIQKNIRYFIIDRGIGGLQAHPAADIFRNHYGDCKDKTTLAISMLQAVGIHAAYMPVDHRRGFVDPENPSLMGDHMITAIEIPSGVQDARLQAVVQTRDGKRFLIYDPTDEHTPIGNLPSNLQGGAGLLADGDSSQIVSLPVLPPESSGTEQTGSFALATDGVLTGSVSTSHTGPEGGEFREFIQYTDEKERREYWERYVAETLPGIVLDGFEFNQPADLAKPMEFHYKVTARDYAHAAGPMLLVRPRVVGSLAKLLDDKPRTLPIDLGATGRWHDSFEITIPAGYVIDEMPDPVALDLDFASYHSSVIAKGNTLHYEREYLVRQVELPAEKVAQFRLLQGTILADEKAAAVLKKQ